MFSQPAQVCRCVRVRVPLQLGQAASAVGRSAVFSATSTRAPSSGSAIGVGVLDQRPVQARGRGLWSALRETQQGQG